MIDICQICRGEKEGDEFSSEDLDSFELWGDEVAYYGNRFTFICKECQYVREIKYE